MNQATNLKNLVFPGVKVKDIDVSHETYSLEDPQTNSYISFSPAILTVDADSLEDLAEFAMRDEFRSVDILEPFEIRLSGRDTGRLLALMNKKVREQAMIYARHLNQQ